MRAAVFFGLLFLETLAGQSIRVYSEFRRVDLFGDIVPADSIGRPREILSPLMARNCHSTFTVMVEAPANVTFYFYVEPLPEKVFDVTVYKQMYRRTDRRGFRTACFRLRRRT